MLGLVVQPFYFILYWGFGALCSGLNRQLRTFSILALSVGILSTNFTRLFDFEFNSLRGMIELGLYATAFYLFLLLAPTRSNFRKLWLFIGITSVLLVLILLKYESLAKTTTGLEIVKRDILKILGISYLSFRLIHVLIDHYYDQLGEKTFLSFLAYFFFFPSALVGPIHRYQNFILDLKQGSTISVSVFQRIIIGLIKSLVLTSILFPYVLGQFEPYGQFALLQLVFACMVYSVYIYLDFSGYTDIAIGVAQIVGVRLPENFNKPFFAENMQEFWQRWHMSLSSWLRDYLFNPVLKFLTENRSGKISNPVFAIFFTFCLAGVWHGDGLNFLIFGILHGLGLALAMYRNRSKQKMKIEKSKSLTYFNRSLVFLYVSLAWIPFVYSWTEMLELFQRLYMENH
ncbi:MAG: hypothetical protein A4S09_00260 [Proteobacteria bacterium SG_bin7]|nr:MAG: hypothetical protein A4S09_00260 [Proteobacteria bacterium SG_bin7]